MKKKILSSLLGLLLGGALLAGCGTPSVPSVEPVEKVTAVPQATQEAVQEAEEAGWYYDRKEEEDFCTDCKDIYGAG